MSTLSSLFTELQNKEREFENRAGIESYGSVPVPSIDVEPPREFKAEFVYNRFELDELTNDTGNYRLFHRVQNNVIIEAEDVLKRIPRYNKLTWQQNASILEEDDLDLTVRKLSKEEIEDFIFNGQVNDIRNFSGGNYFNLILKDTGLDSKLHTVISSSFVTSNNAEILAATRRQRSGAGLEGRILQEQAEAIRNNLSIIEQAQQVHDGINAATRRNIIRDGVFNPETAQIDNEDNPIQGVIQAIVNSFGQDLFSNDYAIYDDATIKSKIVDISNRIRNIQFKGVVNNKYIYTLTKNVERDSVGVFSDEFSNFSFVFENIEKNAIAQGPQAFELAVLERSLTSVEDFNISNLCQAMQNVSDDLAEKEEHKTSLRIIGYIIDKYFVDIDGNAKFYDSIVIAENKVTTFNDREIVYGATYHYKLSFLLELIMPFSHEGQEKFARILIKSDFSQAQIRTIETKPPNAPQDLRIVFSRQHKKLHITWAKDVSLQRDVKKYLVFRRFSTSDAFTLVHIINFLPNEYAKATLIGPKHTLDPVLKITKLDYEQCFVFDDFDINKEPIYAIVACDAHEMYSGYSAQYKVKYDAVRGRATVKQISPPNAPLPYPNFYINEALFQKVIFTENTKLATLYFNPDAIAITKPTENDPEGSAINVVAYKNDESYKISMLNTDLGITKVIHINVDDNRLSR